MKVKHSFETLNTKVFCIIERTCPNKKFVIKGEAHLFGIFVKTLKAQSTQAQFFKQFYTLPLFLNYAY
jgi:hypothetical protein